MQCVLDIHKRSVVALVVDHGQKEKVRRLRAGKTSVEGFLRTLPAGTPVIMESCYAWEYVYDLAVQLGLAPLVAHTGRLKKGEKKTDVEDCRRLLREYRNWTLVCVQVLPAQVRSLRDELRTYVWLTGKSTSIKNRIHFLTDRLGLHPLRLALGSGTGRAQGLRLSLPRAEAAMLHALLASLTVLEQQREALRRDLQDRLADIPGMQLLLSIPGAGPVLTAAIALEIGDIGRFPDGEKLSAYAGLVPRLHQSGQTARHGRLRKGSNPTLRWALVELARHGITQDPALRARYERHLRGTVGPGATPIARGKAVVAVARYLSVVIWCMLSRGEGFRRQEQRAPAAKLEAIRKGAAPYPLGADASAAGGPTWLDELQQALSGDAGIDIRGWDDPSPS